MRKLFQGLCLVSLFIGCRSVSSDDSKSLANEPPNKELKNYSGSIVCYPQKILLPKSLLEVQDAVRRAAVAKKNVRVISLASSRSYSPVICPEVGGTVINVEALNKIISIDSKALTAIVQPGILVGDLQDQLDEKGFTFPVTPDYNGVSLAGGMGTGAHHSSLRFATGISDWIDEIKVIDGRGDLQTISGKDLETARVHLGLLGVIVEMKIRILPQYKLQYGADKIDDAKLEGDIVSLVKNHDYARVMWFPSNKIFVLDHFDKVPMTTPGESYNTTWTSTPNISWLGDIPIGTLNSSQFAQCAAETVRAKTFFGMYKTIDSSSKAPVGRSHKMIAGSCEPGKCSWDYGIKTRTVEVGMPLSKVKDWIADVRSILAVHKGCFPILGIYMRFSAASNAALGEAYGHDSFVFEIHVPQTSKPTLEPSSDVYDEIVQMSLAKYEGRPHWGKNSLPYFLNLGPEQYPEWNTFETLRKRMDPGNVFKNPFWSQIQAKKSDTPNAPGCAVAKTCICATDSDCGPNATCGNGGFFTEAKVCRKN